MPHREHSKVSIFGGPASSPRDSYRPPRYADSTVLEYDTRTAARNLCLFSGSRPRPQCAEVIDKLHNREKGRGRTRVVLRRPGSGLARDELAVAERVWMSWHEGVRVVFEDGRGRYVEALRDINRVGLLFASAPSRCVLQLTNPLFHIAGELLLSEKCAAAWCTEYRPACCSFCLRFLEKDPPEFRCDGAN